MRKRTEKKVAQMPEMKDFPSARLGDKNGYITVAQANLKNRGYDIGKKGISGVFDEDLKKAVKAFQKDIGMPVPNGNIGPKTWAALQESKVSRLPERPAKQPKTAPVAPVARPAAAEKAEHYALDLGSMEARPIASPVPIQPAIPTAVPHFDLVISGLTRYQADMLAKILAGGMQCEVIAR